MVVKWAARIALRAFAECPTWDLSSFYMVCFFSSACSYDLVEISVALILIPNLFKQPHNCFIALLSTVFIWCRCKVCMLRFAFTPNDYFLRWTCCSTRVSNELGAGNPEAARLAIWAVMVLEAAEVTIASTTLFCCRYVLASGKCVQWRKGSCGLCQRHGSSYLSVHRRGQLSSRAFW